MVGILKVAGTSGRCGASCTSDDVKRCTCIVSETQLSGRCIGAIKLAMKIEYGLSYIFDLYVKPLQLHMMRRDRRHAGGVPNIHSPPEWEFLSLLNSYFVR